MDDILTKAQKFEDDFVDVMLRLSALSAKYNLPRPEILLAPEWHSPIRCMPIVASRSMYFMGNKIEFSGIPIYFGVLEHGATILRP